MADCGKNAMVLQYQESHTGKDDTMTRTEFQILELLVEDAAIREERTIGDRLGKSPRVIKRTLKDLREQGLIHGFSVTREGLQSLQPFRVKRAVFIAAGFGSRLAPVTLNTPKPLVRVHGVRMIDTLIDAVLAAGIKEIHIVRGYLAEQFDQLLYKYPMIRFVENPDYNESNNISSALRVANLFENAYVFEADLVLKNPGLIKKYQYTSNYLGCPVKRTDDWCLIARNGVIKKTQVGGTDCYRWIGVSYWSREDGKKLKKHIPAVYRQPGGKERLWDMVPLEYFKNEYRVEVRACAEDDIMEIDSMQELQDIDPAYRG